MISSFRDDTFFDGFDENTRKNVLFPQRGEPFNKHSATNNLQFLKIKFHLQNSATVDLMFVFRFFFLIIFTSYRNPQSAKKKTENKNF